MSGWRPSASPTVSPGPVTTLSTPSGIPASAPSSAIRSRLSDVVEAGLITTVFPVASAGPELPGGHLRRVVPGDDGRDDAHRLTGDRGHDAFRGGCDLAVELVGRLGVPADARGGLGHVEADGVGDRLAGVERLDDPELARVGIDEVRPAQEHALAIAGIAAGSSGRRPRHVARPPPPRRRPRPRRARPGRAAGPSRVLGREPGAAGRVPERAVDEQLGPQVEPVDRRRRLRLVGDQGVGHRGASGWFVRSRCAG